MLSIFQKHTGENQDDRNPDSTAEFLSIVEEIQGLKNLEKGKDIGSLIQLLNCFVTLVLGSQNG